MVAYNIYIYILSQGHSFTSQDLKPATKGYFDNVNVQLITFK